jgi:hypothetical protein
MNLFETLKELKKINPDPAFSENSRRMVLMSAPTEQISPRRVLARSFAVAGSLVMAGALVFIIVGGLSATNLAPQFSSIDPTALRAEAQAIDMQINLLNVNYAEVTASTEPVALMSPGTGQPLTMNVASSSAKSAASSTATSTISVDEVLQELSR